MIKYLFFSILVHCCIINFSCQLLGMPPKNISACEIDLDKNGETDLAFVIQNSEGCKLIVLMQINGAYKAFLLFNRCENMNLSCNYGYSLKETTTGNLEGKEFKTNGTFLLLSNPESSKVAFFWTGNKFKKVWIAG